MKVYVDYSNTLHLSRRASPDEPNSYVSVCGLTNAHDIRDYARNGGARIYSLEDVDKSRFANPRYDEANICGSCFKRCKNLNEIPLKFRDRVDFDGVDISKIGSPSSVATDGGEIEEYIEKNKKE